MRQATRLRSVPRTAGAVVTSRPARVPLGKLLLDAKAVSSGDLLRAVALRGREEVRLGDILLTHGWVSEADLLAALAVQWSSCVVDLSRDAPDPRLIDRLGAEMCLREGVLPWRRVAGETLIATARPETFSAIAPDLIRRFGPCRMVLAPEAAIHAALLARRQTALIRRAEASVPAAESCRHDRAGGLRGPDLAFIALAAIALGLVLAPLSVFGLIFGWTMLTLIASMVLKGGTAWAEVRASTRLRGTADRRGLPDPTPATPIRLPMISLLVPLYREADIAARLVARLGALAYPRELLDVLLVVEEADSLTREALAAADLPRWMRVVVVPDGPVRTKPRAMNYALHFCRGSIVGVYDAEDCPQPDQLHVVAARFAAAPPEVACLQGVLDFYNPRSNWLARCFTIEYAVWFRVFLPGLARLGLVVPLGGTTLFFRRAVLDRLGAWDAWNVTEDADLGLRLARRGYRTELIPTVTGEEANCRPLPWVKQRSRWLKGFAMTWAVHMRDPVGLWRDLGTKRFIAVQALLLASYSQYLLAPVLWSCWIMLMGLPHPVQALLPHWGVMVLAALFMASEVLNIAVAAWAVRGENHRHLLRWTPTMHLYFPLGTFAGWKALYETVTRPFYWDKTSHGLFDAPLPPAAPAEAPPP